MGAIRLGFLLCFSVNRTVLLKAPTAFDGLASGQQEHGGTTVKKLALAAVLAFGLTGAHAAAIDLVPATQAAIVAAPIEHRVPDLAVTPGVQALLPGSLMSELPEPEVFAMMLVGLILIGYRARRSEKFK
ncbi:MAG: hypothetical protein ACXWC4_06340 [Telluria sp.]